MKLLGLRLDAHDANVTYYDGETVRYRSFERDYQNKHHGFDHGIYEWTRILEDWNIQPWFIDGVMVMIGEFAVARKNKFLSRLRSSSQTTAS